MTLSRLLDICNRLVFSTTSPSKSINRHHPNPPPVRRALFLGCLLQMFQQIAGINTVRYYSATIIQMAEFYDTAKALVASVNFLCTFIGIYLVEKVGRRRLTLGSLLGVVLSLAFMIVDSNAYSVAEFYHNKTDLCNSVV